MKTFEIAVEIHGQRTYHVQAEDAAEAYKKYKADRDCKFIDDEIHDVGEPAEEDICEV